jgi:pSer/pThr/pTyr-binding forkhead associated (FHA) protein
MIKQAFIRRVPSGEQLQLADCMLIGRGTDNDLQLKERSGSKKHALLTILENEVWLRDLNSTNGTFVNGKRIESRMKLKSNDEMRFGCETCVFVILEQEPPKSRIRNNCNASSLGVPSPWLNLGQADGHTRYVPPRAMGTDRVAHSPIDQWSGKLEGPTLLFSSSSGEPTRIELKTSKAKPQWTIGSDATCDIQLCVEGVSGLHATLITDGKKWKLIDQLARNGTLVNGKRCVTSYLRSGDLISLGEVDCYFCLPESSRIRCATGQGLGVTLWRAVFGWLTSMTPLYASATSCILPSLASSRASVDRR